jgi:hypothetical protein
MSSAPPAVAALPFEPVDDRYVVRIRESFARQGAMRLIGATPGSFVNVLPMKREAR